MSEKRVWHRLFAALLLLQVGLGLYGIAQPVAWGHQGFHVAEHGLSARNLARHGSWMPSHHVGPGGVVPDSISYHHPLLLHPYIAAATQVVGERPWTARGVQLLFSVLALAGLWGLTRRLRDEPTAALACATFLLTPLHLAFSNLPDHQLIGIAYVLWSCVGLVDWLRTNRWASLGLWLGAALLAGLTDWPWYPIALCLLLGLLWRTWRGGGEGWHPQMTSRRVLHGLALFSVVVLVPFIAHFAAAMSSPRWDDLMQAYAARGASGPVGHFLSHTAWRLYAMHTPPLVLVTWLWVYQVLRHRRSDLGSLVVMSVFVGQTVWLLAMQNEFLVHEYRSYWYMIPVAFASGDVGVRWFRALRRHPKSSRTRRYAPVIVLVALLGWSVGHLRHNLVTSRRMSGSISFQGYEPQHELMTAAHVVRAMTSLDRDLVLVGGGLQPRREVQYLLDRRMETIWSPDEVSAALARGESVVVIDGVSGLKQHAGWRPLFSSARTLRIGSIAVLDLRSTGPPAVDALDVVLGQDYGPLDSWLYAPLTGPLRLTEGSTRSAMWLARQMDAPDELIDSARRRGELAELIPEAFRGPSSKAPPSPRGSTN
jgi:hypothetical protein